MRIPHRALVALANGEKFVLMRNVGQPFEPKLEKVQELDLELTNFSAGVRHQDPKTLGQIRQHCHQETQARIAGEIAKDLINQPIGAIERALSMA